MAVINRETTFLGYRRENGRVGVRNHVIILPLDDLSNAAAEAVAHNIKGALAIPHPYGRLQFGADLDLHFRTLIGAGSNPNVARSEEHTSELQSRRDLVCRLLLEKKKKTHRPNTYRDTNSRAH